MNILTKLIIFIGICLLVNITSSCSKGWLEEKPNIGLTIPEKLEDYQALLNNRRVFGVMMPGMGEIANDDYYLTDESWESLYTTVERNGYFWADDIYEESLNSDWINAYNQILQANVGLEGLDRIKVETSQIPVKDNIKGQAFFFRANCLFSLAQLFCKPYDQNTAGQELGLPLKLSADLDEKLVRSSLEDTYRQIIADLESATQLLYINQEFKTRPSKVAAWGLLSRIYLSMEDYENAGIYANKVLNLHSLLMDYNDLNKGTDYPVPLFNDEVIWHGELSNYSSTPLLYGLVDTVLYESYAYNDLRKNIFFFKNNGGFQFRGSYNGTHSGLFSGLAADEFFLIDAECKVRAGEIANGMKRLNNLLENRFKTGEFVAKTPINENDALEMILNERRKELVFRGLRWSDLRRLNKDPRFEKTLYRVLDGVKYKLEPKSPKYTFLIPPNEIQLSGIEQNKR